MKLLFLCLDAAFPPTNGLTMRTWSVVKSLSAAGHEVDLLAFTPPCALAATRPAARYETALSCEFIPFVATALSEAGAMAARLRALSTGRPYSVARFECSAMRAAISRRLNSGGYGAVICDSIFPAVNLPPRFSVPLILNTHNLEYMIVAGYARREFRPPQRLYAGLEWRLLRGWETGWWGRAAAVLACSRLDCERIQRRSPGVRCLVLPNTVDTAAYLPQVLPAGPRTTLYTGGLDWHPNRDAVLHFVERVLPGLRHLVPGARFIAAGRNPPPQLKKRLARIPGVECLGPVDDMRALIARASVCVVPLRMGSGTRLKILEAAAMAKPIVSTTLGAEGLDFVNGRDLLLADSPAAFAAATASLLLDPAAAARLGAAARITVAHLYSQPVLGPVLDRVLAGLSSQPAALRSVAAQENMAV